MSTVRSISDCVTVKELWKNSKSTEEDDVTDVGRCETKIETGIRLTESSIAGIAIGANFKIYLLRQFCSN